ncbi:hypothetical protein [Streptomyces sp. NBC_01794]|uniref:hypothetical protein n=1 Tax=Streptomyces sp. NBC_01794 TaxID=2975942 RepID=UPI0030854856|nr:hypothetical protein OIE54_01365 [Streptomyces sp. NBC_01794]
MGSAALSWLKAAQHGPLSPPRRSGQRSGRQADPRTTGAIATGNDSTTRTKRSFSSCKRRSVLPYAAAWLAIALVAPGDDSFDVTKRNALTVLVVAGVPTLFLAILAGLAHTQMDVTRFRVTLAIPILDFAWPLLAASTDEPLMFQIMAQLAFVWLMPAPLVPENWLGQENR